MDLSICNFRCVVYIWNLLISIFVALLFFLLFIKYHLVGFWRLWRSTRKDEWVYLHMGSYERARISTRKILYRHQSLPVCLMLHTHMHSQHKQFTDEKIKLSWKVHSISVYRFEELFDSLRILIKQQQPQM